jgi:hypothetical protein
MPGAPHSDIDESRTAPKVQRNMLSPSTSPKSNGLVGVITSAIILGLGSVATIVLFAIIGRRAGIQSLSEFVIASTIARFVAQLSRLGLPAYIVVSHRDGSDRRLAALRLGASLGGLISLVSLASLLLLGSSSRGSIAGSILWGLLSVGPQNIALLVASIAVSEGRAVQAGLLQSGLAPAMAVLICAAYSARLTTTISCIAILIGWVGAAVWSMLLTRRWARTNDLIADKVSYSLLLRESSNYLPVNIYLGIIDSAPLLVVSATRSQSEVGLTSIIIRAAASLPLVMSALTNSQTAELRHHQRDPVTFMAAHRTTQFHATVLSVPVALIGAPATLLYLRFLGYDSKHLTWTVVAAFSIMVLAGLAGASIGALNVINDHRSISAAYLSAAIVAALAAAPLALILPGGAAITLGLASATGNWIGFTCLRQQLRELT